MVEFLNSQKVNLDITTEEEQSSKLPPLKKKHIRKIPVPHYPNVYAPMSEKEIMEFQKKYPNRKIDLKNLKSDKSEQVELKDLYGSSNKLSSNDVYDNVADVISDNSIVGDVYLEEDRTNNYIKGYWSHKLGKCYSFCADKRGNPLIIMGKRWYIYVLLSLLIHGLLWFTLIFYKDELEDKLKIPGIVFSFIFQLFYTISFLINPGFPRNNIGRMKGIPTEQYKYCSECLFYIDKNKKVNHCFKCGICVEGFHRHSFLVNKCIGRKSKILFYIFITFLIVNIIYIAILIGLGNR